MESQFRLHEARKAEAERLAASEQWLREFPVKQLVDWGIIRKSGTKAQRAHDLLGLFGVASPAAFDQRYAKVGVHYRRSASMAASRLSLLTWLRYGEILAISREGIPPYNKAKFYRHLTEIRKLTKDRIQEFQPKVTELCQEAGVVFLIIPPLPKTRLSGAAFWTQEKVPVIQQSLRHKTNDHFWFTFFHEAAHILLHNPKNLYADDENGTGDGVEREANNFATEILVGKKALADLITKEPLSISDVRQFANAKGIHPGIVVGMLQHHGVIPWDQMNYIKDKYEWDDSRNDGE